MEFLKYDIDTLFLVQLYANATQAIDYLAYKNAKSFIWFCNRGRFLTNPAIMLKHPEFNNWYLLILSLFFDRPPRISPFHLLYSI